MGMFDEMIGGLLGAEGLQPEQLGGMMDVLSAVDAAGVGGLVRSFQEKGLGEIVMSWIGSGENLPVTPEQLREALGSDLFGDLAAKTGLSADELSGRVAAVLPGLIDQLTPDGAIPEGSLMQLVMGRLMGAFG